MKKIQLLVAALALAVSAVTAHANTLVAEFNGAGSSAQFNTFALAASTGSAVCGNYHWTKSNVAFIVDPRSGSIQQEKGNIWIVWNGSADGTAANIVCYYVTVDSIVGMRAYFANATVNLPASNIGAADGATVPYIGGTGVALPAAIQGIVNGSKINFAATDIRPEDAKFASNRAMTSYGVQMTGRAYTGLGYQASGGNPVWLGTPIVSSVSTAAANPVDWAFVPGDTDPVTGGATRPYLELAIGAAPVMVFANTSNAGAGHMGDPALAINNIDSRVLNNALLGQIGHVRDLSSTGTGAADAALHVWVREALSGTYNTMEFNVPNTNSIAGEYAQGPGRVTGQDAGINTANTACAGVQTPSGCPAESGNPLWHVVNANGSSRGRVIGSGEMISTANTVADSLGYSFWGFSSFSTSKAGNLKYLTVDGADPLYSSINPNPNGTGVLPQCPATPCILPFDNIKNGGYPIWSKYRGVYDYTDPLNLAPNLVAGAQTASTTLYSDFVPDGALNVFRSHFAQVVTTAGGAYPGYNGLKSGVPELGGDMGGQVLTKQSEVDFIADTGGNQQVNLHR
jgi:hypothetical protein